MTLFSVVICTYNRPELLGMALDALIYRTIEKPDQVVVVNGGDERSDHVVKRYQDQHRIRVELIRTINRNPPTSRNIGLVQCDGDIVATTDDDAEVFPDWVSQIKAVHAAHPEAGGVGGAVLGAHSSESLLSRIADIITFSSPPNPGYVRTIAGVNVSYKRAALQLVGLQDEALFCGEDVDFNWRIKKLGYEIYYNPAIKVLHYHRPSFKQFVNQFYMYGRAYYLVRRKWPEMYCVYPHKIHTIKDILKAINVLLRPFYLPFIHASRLRKVKDQILSLPVFLITGIAWTWGVFRQRCHENER